MVCLLFDLDGTLMHTKPEYAQEVFTAALARYGITPTRDQCLRLWYGGDRNAQLERMGLDPSVFWPWFQQVDKFERRLQFTAAYPDVAVLEQLKAAGHSLGIVTNAPKYIAEAELALVPARFDIQVCSYDGNGILMKPEPAGILHCIQTLRADPALTMMVGNGEEDMLAARAAGVLDVFNDRGEYKNGHVHASHKIRELYELGPIIEMMRSVSRR